MVSNFSMWKCDKIAILSRKENFNGLFSHLKCLLGIYISCLFQEYMQFLLQNNFSIHVYICI